MDLLILGGTSFVGRHLVEASLDRGHSVTLFNRGRTNAGLFEGRVEERRGDRGTGDYASLADGRWDAVIDVTAYVPRAVTQAVDALHGRVSRYTFVSTVSVFARPGELAQIEDRSREDVTGETYGPLKVACEDEVRTAFGDRSTVVRPGIVAGPHDPTERFTHWVRTGAAGGEVTIPRRTQPVQAIHARDLGEFVVHVTEVGASGPFEAVGERHALSDLIERAAVVAGAEITVREGGPEGEAPLVLPSDGSSDWLFTMDPGPATGAGLRNRPIEDLIADTLAWDRSR